MVLALVNLGRRFRFEMGGGAGINFGFIKIKQLNKNVILSYFFLKLFFFIVIIYNLDFNLERFLDGDRIIYIKTLVFIKFFFKFFKEK